MPSNYLILCHPLLLLPSIFPSIRVFSKFSSGGQSIGASASASVLPMNIQGWLPLRLTGFISLLSNGLLRVFSNTTVWRYQFFSTQPFQLCFSLWLTQPSFRMMYSAQKLNKQGLNIQPWHTPFPILNQSVVPCLVLTVASWPAYSFLRRWVIWAVCISGKSITCWLHCLQIFSPSP